MTAPTPRYLTTGTFFKERHVATVSRGRRPLVWLPVELATAVLAIVLLFADAPRWILWALLVVPGYMILVQAPRWARQDDADAST